ncbi:MAG: AAA family ATPase [Opitutales bacterium]|nr:AAA family ATPase [Opitutales bacterium]
MMQGETEESSCRTPEEAKGLLLRILFEGGGDPRIVALCDSLGLKPVHLGDGPAASLLEELTSNQERPTPNEEPPRGVKEERDQPPDETLIETPIEVDTLKIDCGPIGEPLPENVRALVITAARALHGFRAQAALDRAAPLIRPTDPGSALDRLGRIREILDYPIPALLSENHRETGAPCDGRGTNMATVFQSPWPSLNQLLGPLRAGQVVLLAGRPQSGKRGFMIQWMAAHLLGAPETAVAPCIMVSAAKVADEVRTRAAAYSLGIPMFKVRRGELEEKQKALLGELIQRLEKSAWTIMDEREADLGAAFKAARACVGEGRPAPLLVIDFLQLLKLPDGMETRHAAAAGRIFAYIRETARQIGSPVIIAMQLNDHPELRQRPARLPDIREQAIGVEAHADTIICFPQPPEDPSAPAQDFPLSIPCNRFGGAGTLQLTRCLRTGCLEDPANSGKRPRLREAPSTLLQARLH